MSKASPSGIPMRPMPVSILKLTATGERCATRLKSSASSSAEIVGMKPRSAIVDLSPGRAGPRITIGWEAIYGALKLRDRIRGENWRCDLNSVQFRFQLGLREKCWTLDQVIRADTRKEKRFSASITDHEVFLRVRLHCAN